MNEQFLKNAGALLNEKLFKTEELFLGGFPRLSEEFTANFQRVCEETAALQTAGGLGDIAYIEYTLLRTNAVNRNYMSEVRIYGEKRYMCKSQRAAGEFDVSFLFKHFDELWGELIESRRQYAGKVSAIHVKEFMMDAAPKFYSYAVPLCRFSILGCVGQDYFRAVKKSPRFEINAGEYMARTETVYRENAGKDRAEILRQFAAKPDLPYCSEDFSGLDFSNENLAGMDFRYADLRGAILENTNFAGANLTGARFCGANAKNADFSRSFLHEADFGGADLQNAKFTDAAADGGLTNEKEWQAAGFFGIRFKDADLRGADFTGADCKGADFTGALMDSAAFDAAKKNGLTVSPAQSRAIRFVP